MERKALLNQLGLFSMSAILALGFSANLALAESVNESNGSNDNANELKIEIEFIEAVTYQVEEEEIILAVEENTEEKTNQDTNENRLPWLKGAFEGEYQAGLNEQDDDGSLKSQKNNCRFQDIAGHQSETAINALYDQNVVGGTRPCYFEPNAATTRAEATTIAVRAIEAELPASNEESFPDVNKKAWYPKYVQAAKNEDIVHGYPTGDFKADETVNKVEALKIIGRAFGYHKLDSADFSDKTRKEVQSFEDVDLDQWYAQYIWIGVENDLIQAGVKLNPEANVTRAEYADWIYALLNK